MKIDKDQLIKQRFWILVGLSVPFAAIAILLLVTSVSSSIADTRSKLDKALKEVNGVKNPQAEVAILERKAAAEALLKKETTVWGAAFKEQEVLFRWPRKMEEDYHFADGMFANEVQILKMPDDKAAWPKNKDDLIHGVLKSTSANDFVVETYDPEKKPASAALVRFLVTPRLLMKDAVTDKESDGSAAILYQNLQGKVGKFLAVGCQKGRYFADRLTSDERIAYEKTYLSQIPPILRQVDPLRIEMAEDGKTAVVAGVVQFRSPTGWTFRAAEAGYGEAADKNPDWDEIPVNKKELLIPPENVKFLRFLARKWDISNDISEEAWIAQEELWIQSEIYRVIRAANDSISNFKNISGKATKEGEQVDFQNPYFDISFRVKDAKSFDVRIANRLNRRQRIDGMNLRIKFGENAKPDVVPISGDLLEARGDPGKKDAFQKNLPLPRGGIGKYKHIYGLEQVLTWDMAAVKRIDQIAIGSIASDDISFSHRTFPMGLQPLVKVEKKEEPEKQGGNLNMPGQQPPGPSGKGPANKDAGGALANGFLPDRYQEVTPQFRRVPVAIALIVDQNHVDRVQTAFNNSKLRILVTQVLLNHYPQSLKPLAPSDKAADADKQGGGQLPPGFGFGPMGAGKNNFPGGQGAAAPAAAVDDLEANMELVIYGVVTLYERFPARAPQTAATEPAK